MTETTDTEIVDDGLPLYDYMETVRRLEIVSIMPIELRARRRDGGFDDLPLPDADQVDEADAENPQMQVFLQDQAERLLVRARAEGLMSRVEYTVDIAVMYQKSEPFGLTAEAHSDVVDLLALPNLYPYLRQHIHDITSRAGQPLTLSIARFGRGSAVPLQPDVDAAAE